MLPSHSRDPQTKRALWLCTWEVERLYLEVPLSSGEGGLWDFEMSQQRQAQVTAVLQTGLSWDTCWEVRNGVWQPEPCLPQIIIILKRILWFRGSPSAHRHPLLSWKPSNPDVQVMFFLPHHLPSNSSSFARSSFSSDSHTHTPFS